MSRTPLATGCAVSAVVALAAGCGDGETTVIERETRVVTETGRKPPPASGFSGQVGTFVTDRFWLDPRPGEQGVGQAVVADDGGELKVLVQARRLRPTRRGFAYEVWLFNDTSDAVSLGAQLTDRRGRFQGVGPLPGDYGRYLFLDVSRERIDENVAHSGESVLRGAIPAE